MPPLFLFVCIHLLDRPMNHCSFFYLVPNNSSDFVRRFVESLLITHTECKLNTAGRLSLTTEMDMNNPLAHGLWYETLVRPLFPRF